MWALAFSHRPGVRRVTGPGGLQLWCAGDISQPHFCGLSVGERALIGAMANFCSVNTLTLADLELLVVSQWLRKFLKIEQSSLVSQLQHRFGSKLCLSHLVYKLHQ